MVSAIVAVATEGKKIALLSSDFTWWRRDYRPSRTITSIPPNCFGIPNYFGVARGIRIHGFGNGLEFSFPLHYIYLFLSSNNDNSVESVRLQLRDKEGASGILSAPM